MTQGRTAKVKEYGLEEEVVSLLRQGMGPKVISDLLNKRHPQLSPPLNHVNIISFRDGLDPATWKAVQTAADKDFVPPVEKLRAEMEMLRETIFPQLASAIEKGDIKTVRVLSTAFVNIWDRVIKLEEITNPSSEAKSKLVHLQKQFDTMNQRLSEVFGRLCPECRAIVLDSVKELVGPPNVQA